MSKDKKKPTEEERQQIRKEWEEIQEDLQKASRVVITQAEVEEAIRETRISGIDLYRELW